MGVAVFDRDADRAAELAKELGDGAIAADGDVNDDDDVGAAIEVARSLGPLSLVVNVAGGGLGGGRTVGRGGVMHDKTAFVATMEMNAFGTFNVSRLGAAAMAENEPDADGQRGVIVNTGSDRRARRPDRPDRVRGGQGGHPRHDPADGTRPRTDRGAGVCDRAGHHGHAVDAGRARCETKEKLVESIVFPKRMGRPEEFAFLVESIARNPYLNGEIIRLDGALRFPPK